MQITQRYTLYLTVVDHTTRKKKKKLNKKGNILHFYRKVGN